MATQRVSRLAWSLAAGSLAMLIGGAPLVVINSDAVGSNLPVIVLFSSCAVIGALAVARQPRNRVGWLFLAIGLVAAPQVLLTEVAILIYRNSGPSRVVQWLAWPGDWGWVLAFGPLLSLLPLLFPDGRPPSRRWRPVIWLALWCIFYESVSLAIGPGRFDKPPVRNPAAIGTGAGVFSAVTAANLAIAAVVCIVCVSSLFFRYRRAGGDERQRVKWFGLGAGFTVTCAVLGFATQALGAPVVSDVLGGIGVLGIPAGAAVGVLRFKLFDIDVVISKTIVYGSLAILISAVYAALVAGVGQLAGSVGTPALSAIAAAVVALAFQPARRRFEHLANRLVYGRRATPYEVLAEFSAHVAHAYDIEEIPAAIAQITAAGTGASRAEVWLRVGHELRSAARWPADSPASVVPIQMPTDGLPTFDGAAVFRVVHQGEILGAIIVQAKPGDRLSADHDKLITNLANQAGLALHNVRLLEDIRASRQRIVTAQDAAARRLERNIHDGAQQLLVALTIKARLAESLVGQDDAEAQQMLAEIAVELQDALRELRDLARGIYPPLLAEAGLAAALRAQAGKSALPVIVESEGLARYPAEAEAAVYFCALEALQNIAKYARASQATARLSACDGTLAFTVEDDGVGFDPATRGRGTGIQGMSDRLAALGGELRVISAPGSGTRVEGRVRLRELAADQRGNAMELLA